MAKRKSIRIIALITALVVAESSSAMTMQEVFDSVNADGNVSKPGILQGQTMNMLTGGSMFMRTPRHTYQLVTMTPPSWGAGCGGIDLFAGGFSFINKEQFVAMLRNIGSNSLGYAFKLAIQNLCPTCDNVMQALQATANSANRLNVDSCEAAKGLVNASIPDTWTRGRQNAAKNYGVDMNMFSDVTDAWGKVMGDESKSDDVVNDVKNSADEGTKDSLPSGNVVWRALKKLDGMDDQHRMVLMSMLGSVVFDTSTNDGPKTPKVLIRKEIDVKTLIGTYAGGDTVTIPIWQCDSTDADGCLNPTEGTVTVTSFRKMVGDKLYSISDKISSRQPHDNVQEVIAFLNVTDLPVYKMLAVSTSLNNTAISDSLIGKYQDLIAAKFAEVFIDRAVADLRAAIGKYSASATDPAVSKTLEGLKPDLEAISQNARQVMQTAYAQTVSTYNMAQEVQHLEQAVNSNLSQALRNSLAFGKGLH